MLDAERLLGQLLQLGLKKKHRRKGRNRSGMFGGQSSLGLGIFGLALAAFDHFLQQAGGEAGRPAAIPPATAGPPPPPTGRRRTPKPERPVSAADDDEDDEDEDEGNEGDDDDDEARRIKARRSRRGRARAADPPAPAPQPGDPTAADTNRSVWLIRAMIAAATADGVMDPTERNKILETATNSGMPSEDIEFLKQELNRPRSMFELASASSSDVMRRQMFAASLLAIDTDSAAEQQYLHALASALHLSESDVEEIKQQLGE